MRMRTKPYTLAALVFFLVAMLHPVVILNVNAQSGDATPSCTPAKPAAADGQQNISLKVGALDRRYVVHLPKGYNPAQAYAVVLSLHGFTETAERHAEVSRWGALADEAGFIVIFPQGIGFPPRWNNGINPFAPNDTTDDVGYIRAVMADASDRFCTDATRVYATGLSAGGGMANRLACEASDLLTAFGGVSGAYNALQAECQPTRALPAIFLHGDADTIANFKGESFFKLPKVDAFVQDWVARNGCATEPQALDPMGAARGVQYTGCQDDASVVYWVIQGGTHRWFGGTDVTKDEAPSSSIDATRVLWAFFQKYAVR